LLAEFFFSIIKF